MLSVAEREGEVVCVCFVGICACERGRGCVSVCVSYLCVSFVYMFDSDSSE